MITLSSAQEAQLVAEVGRRLYLSPILPTMRSLKIAARARLQEIPEIASQEQCLGPNNREQRLKDKPFLHIPFLQGCSSVIEAFTEIAGAPDEQWAFLFDELELVPLSIANELIAALRTVDERFIFKLSLSPYNANIALIQDAFSAMPGNDYEVIPLWYAHKESGYSFCRDLFQFMLRERGLPPVAPEKILGYSAFDTPGTEYQGKDTAYTSDSRHAALFRRLAENDASFRQYCDIKYIDFDHLEDVDGERRPADLRKIASLAVVREAFRAPDRARQVGRTARRRSRKNPAIYAGTSAIFAMVEGNPRWFKGIVGNLLDLYLVTRTKIPPETQMEQVAIAAYKFRALLRTIPCPIGRNKNKPRAVETLLHSIGSFINKAVVMDKFTADPPGSFVIDNGIDDSLVSSLGLALNAGALVYVPGPTSRLVLNDLHESRFRLTFLLAPIYKIPLILGPARNLSAILADSNVPLLSEVSDDNADRA